MITDLELMALHAGAARNRVVNPEWSYGACYYFSFMEMDSYAAGVLAAIAPECDPWKDDDKIPAFLDWFTWDYEKIVRDDGKKVGGKPQGSAVRKQVHKADS
jgi:hypothetical protein